MSNIPTVRVPMPPVGLPVLWYQHGVINPQKAFPAVVVQSTDRGTITLLVFKGDGHVRTVVGTWWAHDPALVTRDHGARSQRGCWDYLPSPSYRIDLLEEADPVTMQFDEFRSEIEGLRKELRLVREAPVAPSRDPDELSDDVRKLAGQGLGAVEIGERLGMTHQRVTAILRHRSA